MLSQSATSSSSKSDTAMKGMEGEVDIAQIREEFWFPLFSEMSRKVRIPPIGNLFQLVILFIQLFCVFLFLGCDHIWRWGYPEALQILSYFINLGVPYTDFSDAFGGYVFINGYASLLVCFIIYLKIKYSQQHWFDVWQLYVLYILLAIINIMVFVPSSALVGYSIVEIHRTLNAYPICICILSLCSTGFIFIISVYSQLLISSSPYINSSLLGLWNGKLLKNIIIATGLASFFVPLSNILSNWVIFIFLLINITLLIINYYTASQYVCIHFFMNSAVQSFVVFSISLCILTGIHYFIHISSIILSAIPFLLFIISFLIFYFINLYRKNKIIQFLSPNEGIQTDLEKYHAFDSKIFSNQEELIMYIHVGVCFQAPFIIDFSFIKYVLDNYQFPNIVFAVLQVVSFFPSEQQLFSYCMSIVNKFEKEINFEQAYLLYQAKRVNYIRQRAMSQDASQELTAIQKKANDTIAQVRGFWVEILHSPNNIYFSSLKLIRKATIETDTAFYNIYDKYPHSHQICNSYCRFLVEAMGSYEKSLHYDHKMSQIERGRHIVIDYSFRSFVNAFPDYLRNHILDSRGQKYVSPSDTGDLSDNTDTTTTTTTSTSDSDTQINYVIEKNAINLYSHPVLRIALDRSISRSKMTWISFSKFVSFLQFLFAVIILIIFITVLPIISEKPLSLLQSNFLVSNITSDVSYISMAAGYWILSITSPINISRLVANQVLVTYDDFPTWTSILNDPYLTIHNARLDLLQDFKEEIITILSDPSLHSSELLFFNNISTYTYSIITTDYDNLNSYSFQTSLRNYLNYFTSVTRNTSANSNNDEINISSQLTEIIVNGFFLSRGLSDIFDAISITGNNFVSNGSTYLIALTLVIMISLLIIFMLIRLITVYKLKKSFDAIIDLIKLVSEEDILETKNPIYLKSKQKIPIGSIFSDHLFNNFFLLYVIIIVISIAIPCVISFIASFVYSNHLRYMAKVFDWNNQNSLRVSHIMNFLSSVLFLQKSELNNNIQNILKINNFINLEILNNVDYFDEFYFSDVCVMNDINNFAQYVNCLSLTNKLNLVTNYYNILLQESIANILLTPEYLSCFFVIDKHLYKEMKTFSSVLYRYGVEKFDEAKSDTLLICLLGIFAVLVLFIIELYILEYLVYVFDGFKQLILILPPYTVAKMAQFIYIIIGRGFTHDEETLSTQDIIISAYEDAIVSLDGNLIIQSTNPSFSKLTGYNADQTLGQSINWLFPLGQGENATENDYISSFYPKLFEAQNGDCDISMNVTGWCNTDGKGPLNVSVTIISMKNKKVSDNITLIMRDKLPEIELKKEVDFYRKRTEQILSLCIPNTILSLIKSNSETQNFYSKKVTFISIEILGINDFIHSMDSKHLIQNIGFIFSQFDEALQNFPIFSKIQNDVDQYLCVAGIFKDVNKLKEQAQNAIFFMESILNGIEELNEYLNYDLHFRMASHIGGPAYAKIDNISDPSFDIYSSALNTLMVIQKDGDPDQIRCTESFCKYLNPNDYNIEFISKIEGQNIMKVTPINIPQSYLSAFPKLDKMKKLGDMRQDSSNFQFGNGYSALTLDNLINNNLM